MRLLLALGLAALALAGFGYWGAVRSPHVVRYEVVTPKWTAPPITIAHLSDTHPVLPDMPPARLAAIVARVNALKPDLIVLTGDYVSDRAIRTGLVPPAEAVAPLAALRAPLGLFAVLGNHDMNAPGLAAEVTAALRAGGITVLRNAATRRGAAWIAGGDDNWRGVTDLQRALAEVPAGAPALFLVHNPDAWVDVPDRVALTLAGHTHGGQIAPPGIGPLITATNAGPKWARGHIVERGRHMVVSAGLGASILPLRVSVRPEIVLVRISAPAR